MAFDLTLIIAKRETGVVVASHWIGSSKTIDRLRDILKRAPDHTPDYCGESWGRVFPGEMLAINEARYENGPEPIIIQNLSEQFPVTHYMWCLVKT